MVSLAERGVATASGSTTSEVDEVGVFIGVNDKSVGKTEKSVVTSSDSS